MRPSVWDNSFPHCAVLLGSKKCDISMFVSRAINLAYACFLGRPGSQGFSHAMSNEPKVSVPSPPSLLVKGRQIFFLELNAQNSSRFELCAEDSCTFHPILCDL